MNIEREALLAIINKKLDENPTIDLIMLPEKHYATLWGKRDKIAYRGRNVIIDKYTNGNDIFFVNTKQTIYFKFEEVG